MTEETPVNDHDHVWKRRKRRLNADNPRFRANWEAFELFDSCEVKNCKAERLIDFVIIKE